MILPKIAIFKLEIKNLKILGIHLKYRLNP